MVEYIEREAVLRDIREAGSDGGMGDLLNGVLELYIKSVPDADVAPVVHARWKYYHKQNIAVCTNCSFERNLDDNFGKAISCPNCWAKMDLKED